MDEQSLGFVKQLIDKTEQEKISWSTGFEDGQFKTLLPRGELAFVVQVKGDVRRFLMLDDTAGGHPRRDRNTRADTENEPAHHPKLILYSAIGKLQGLARTRALQVNEKLAKAEKLLAAI
jgi:hypothetical protein